MAGKYRRVFSTPEGKEVLEHLTRIFGNCALFEENPHATAYNVGQRDVVMYIKNMKESQHGELEGNTAPGA